MRLDVKLKPIKMTYLRLKLETRTIVMHMKKQLILTSFILNVAGAKLIEQQFLGTKWAGGWNC